MTLTTHHGEDPLDETHESVVALLKAHIPLTLLLDLAAGDPHSEELYHLEAS